MSDIILGAKIQIDTGGSAQAITSTVKGMNDMGNAAKAAQAQFAALSKQAQQSSQSFVSLSDALGMNKAAQLAKDALEAKKAMGMLGAAALAGNQAVAASAGSSSNIMAALTGNLKAAGVELDKTASKSESASKKMVAAHEKVSLSIRSWLPHIRTAGASIGIYFGVRSIANVIRMADAYTDMSSRLKLVSGTSLELTRAQEGLFRIAQANRTPLAETTALYYKLGVTMKDFGASQQDVLAVVDTVGKAMKISGASTIETSAALMQLAQAFAKGKLDGDEFRSVMENAPRLMKALTDEFKIGKDQLYKWSETGQLSLDKLLQAIKNQSGAIKQEFSTIPVTISGAWTELSNAVLKYVGDADQANGVSRTLALAIERLAQNVDTLMKVLFFPATAAHGWHILVALVKELDVSFQNISNSKALTKLTSQDKSLLAEQYGVNQAISPAEYQARRKQNGGEFFDGVNKSAEAATKALKGFNEMQRLIYAASVKYKLDPAMMLGLAQRESNFNPTATNPKDGGRGLFQFMPGTWRGVQRKAGLSTNFDDAYDPKKQVDAAMRYMTEVKRIVWNSRSMADLVAAWNYGPERMVRAINKGRSPESVTTKGHVPNVMKNAANWQQRISNLPSAELDAIKATGKEIEKYQEQQYKSYAEHLKLREKAFDDYTKVELAKQRTQMEQLDAARKAAEDRYKTASAMGDGNAMSQAEAEQMRLIREKQRLLLDSIKIEEQATQKKLGNIGQEIAAAQKLKQYEKVAGLRGERASEQAELAALAERRKQIEITAQGEISKAMRDADDERRKTMKQTADDAVEMARQSREAQDAELGYLQKQEQFRQQIGEQAAQGAKAAIDSQLQQQQAAMAGQKAERDAQLQNLSGLAQIQQARQNINADLQDQLVLIEAEKQAAQAKLAIDQQMLGYQEQMLQAQLATTTERERRLEIESAIAQIHLQQADNLRAVQNAATQANAAAAKAQSEAAKGMGGLDAKEVKERQLRENAYWDQTIERVRRYGQVWTEILGQQADGFGNVALSMAQFGKDLDQITNKYDELDKQRKAMDENGNTRAKETAAATLQAIAATSLGMRKMFKEGSDGYKAMTAMAGAAALAQDALNISDGIAAILKQLKEGDVYSAIPRAIAVAGMVMSMIGHAVGTIAAMGGGSNTVTAEDRQKTQGTGSVFGDTQAQSQSIANSLEIIKSNSSNDLNYSAAMLRALEDLSLNILALANQVTMSVMPSIDAAIKASGMKFGKTNISLFSGFNKQLTDAGIGWFETSLEKIFSGGFTAKMYADVTRSFEVMQSALSSETTTYVRNASKDVTNQIAQIFRDMVKALQEGGKAFGLSGQDVLDSLKGFKIGMEQISLKDMSMEEQTAALNAVFSKFTDKMAERLNKSRDLQLDPFRKAGEGMAETYFRVSEGINRANGELERLNVNAINYQDILNKQGDPAAEIVRQSLAAQTQLSQSVRDYVNVLTGSAEDIIEAYKQILSASNLLKTAGIGDANLSQTMTNAAGGLSEFVSAMEAFNENFLSEADRYAGDMRVLSEQFGALGYALPDSKDAFAAMVRAIDTSTEAGQKLFGQMIALSGSFAKVANEAQAIRDKYAALLDPFKAISDRIKEVGTDFGKLLGGVVGDSQGRINAIGDNANKARGNLTGKQAELKKAVEDRGLQLFNLYSEQDKWQKKLDKELAKKPKDQRPKYIQWYKDNIARINEGINALVNANRDDLIRIRDINAEIANITAQEGIDKAAESARLALEKQGIIDDARLAMGKTLEDIFNGLAQTIQQAQQRLQSVLDLQKSLASQIAQLQGPQAVFGLASTDRNNAFGAIDTYINSLADGRARDVGVEVGLLNTAQQAVMAKYNAEIAAIQEAEREYIAAETERLNAALQLQVEAINAALDAQIKAQSKLDAAAQKAMQKQFDDEQKALRKAHDAQLKALGDELDAANRLRDAIKGIQDYVRGMALGGNSPLSPEQRLAEAQRQYQQLLAKAQGGDADAMAKLSGASDAYLEASKQYYGSGTQYANTFDAVKNAMSALGGMSAPDPDSIQSRIDAWREAQAEEMDLLRESQAERLDALREKQQEAIEAMRQSAQKQIEAAQKATQQAIADLSDPNKNAAMRAAREAAERDLAKLAELAELTRIEAAKQAEEAKQKAQEQAEAALRMAQDQLDALQAGTRLSAQQLGVLSGILQGMGLQPIPIEGYAKGGYAKAGLALVGEQGPEIVRFERPAQVMTADETRDALRGGNDGKIVQAIAELKAEMRAVVVTQSTANPQIIAELSEMKNRLAKMERTQRFTVGS